MIFNRSDFDALSTLFDPEAKYAGYRPTVSEIPNGDGRVDVGKRFLHVALKYNPPEWAVRLLARAHMAACARAEYEGCPGAIYPKIQNGTLRVLYYPAGAGSAAHCDFDLFTVNCWRTPADDCESFTQVNDQCADWRPNTDEVHFGELWRIFGMGPATAHRVREAPYEQRSIVYFASPGMSTPLPAPITFPAVGEFPEKTVHTTGEWQIERTNRSRITGPLGYK